jgi:uncharacterized protein (TIGR00725 family)
MMKTPIPIVAVVGGGDECALDTLRSAEKVGCLLADRGFVLITGGRTGVMEAASAGASHAGGCVVGILPGTSPREANQHVEIAIATGLGEARNAIIATAAQAIIAVGGEFGTLSEIALALKLGKPVVAIHSRWGNIPGVEPATSAEEAVEKIVRILSDSAKT